MNESQNQPLLEHLLNAGGTQTLRAVISAIVNDLYQKGSVALKLVLNRLKLKEDFSGFIERITEIKMVKTIWQVDYAVDLTKFYCPTYVELGGRRFRLNSMLDFGFESPWFRQLNNAKRLRNILIEGVTGQGKSIMLRHLCAVEFLRGALIPVFVELRFLREGFSLVALLREALEKLGFDIQEDRDVELLLETEKFVLLLDAFDEVQKEFRPFCIEALEGLVSRLSKLPHIIVTARPGTEIRHSWIFVNAKIGSLLGDDYKLVIYKLCAEVDLATRLIEQISANSHNIRDFLTTPLLITLLVIKYKGSQRLPAQLSEFYESLFSVLIQRHDGTKAGFDRRRLCKLDDTQYRRVFECFCYLSKFSPENIRENDAYAIAEDALKELEIVENPKNFLNDIIRITCLLLNDGEECHFIHNSVQEFFIASYVRQLSDAVAQTAYTEFAKEKYWPQFRDELLFLEEIDRYRFAKYFFIPTVEGVVKCPVQTFVQMSDAGLKTFLLETIKSIKLRAEYIPVIGRISLGHLEYPSFGLFTYTLRSLIEDEILDPIEFASDSATFAVSAAEDIKTLGDADFVMGFANYGSTIEQVHDKFMLELLDRTRRALTLVEIEERQERVLKIFRLK